jgi:hypothetical protein
VKDGGNDGIGRGLMQDKCGGAGPPQTLGAKMVVSTVDNGRAGSSMTTSSVTASTSVGVD